MTHSVFEDPKYPNMRDVTVVKVTDDLIVREALLNLQIQYQWWMGAVLTSDTEREMAAEKLIRIERTLREVPVPKGARSNGPDDRKTAR